MKIFKTLILIGLIISFYKIQIRYDDSPIESLGSGLLYSLKTGYLLYAYILYIISNVMFFMWYFFNKKIYSLFFILIPFLIWLFWKKTYSGVIDIDLYTKSSIPYLMFSIISIATILIKKNHNNFSSSLS